MFTLFDRFLQYQVAPTKGGCPFTYVHKVLIVFFVIMHHRRIYRFKTQRRWLVEHPELRQPLGFESVPHRTTLSRRYKALYPLLEKFITFLGKDAEDLDPSFENHNLYEDKSLFKAQGPVWHQSDRKEGRIPDKLRRLDTDASWSKSGYHGWVYGYGLHLTCNNIGFPKLVQVETAAVSESQVIDEQAHQIIHELSPHTVSADNSYAQATRIRKWAKAGVILLTPAYKWINGRYAQAYHRFIKEPENAEVLIRRRTAIEPVFDLMAQVLGTNAKQKQLPVQGLRNVRTCLALATLTIQVAMIANSIWGMPSRNISVMAAAFT
jgi:hypothetical protein